MALFKQKSPEDLAVEATRKAQEKAKRERQEFLTSPVGRARSAFERGDQVFQYDHEVVSQQAVIVIMTGSTTTRRTKDPSEILNAVCREGWELVNGSFVFVEQGQQSRDKFMSSGQNVATKGTVIGYYLFKRCPENKLDPPPLELLEAADAEMGIEPESQDTGAPGERPDMPESGR